MKSTADVKAMCVKLIDVLSGHGGLVKFRIDPDITSFLRMVISPPKIDTPRSALPQPPIDPINELRDDMEFIGSDQFAPHHHQPEPVDDYTVELGPVEPPLPPRSR